MKTATLRKLENLETEQRGNQRSRESLLATTAFFFWKVVLAHYLGNLKPDDEDLGEAETRALGYESQYEYLDVLFKGQIADITRRFKDGCRRLFAQAGLDFDHSPGHVLCEAFARLVNELPEQWSQWIESNSPVSRNSRVFTQIGKAAFQQLAIPDHLLLARLQREESKLCFWAFRRYMRPNMKVGWWQYDVANELQRFYYKLIVGKRPILTLMAPPQHGKTEQVTDFIAWLAGKRPQLKTIFASYSDELGVTVNKALRRIMTGKRYLAIFGSRLGDSGSSWVRNSNTLEYPNHSGSFYNTTVEGQITGKRLDLGVIDDPIKSRAEASSKTVRDKVWCSFTDDFLTRSSDSAGLIIIMTRWHVDDPVGRLIERFPDATIRRYPAIAEKDEKNRRKGEPLFPEHKSLSFLLERKRAMTQASWESQYQQNPIIVGGGVIPIEKLRVVPFFDKPNIRRSVRYIDKGGTEDGGAFTAAVLMHRMQDKTYVISHIARGQWGALERERKIKVLVEADAMLYANYEVVIEQEPGSGGKESVEATIRNLAGKRAFADRVTGSKEVRAEPFVAQCQNDNVRLVAGKWVHSFYEEAESWPASKYKDQIDACAGAFNRLALTAGYDHTYAGWQ
jgi:predicted phage terminase large subunit-like protein